MRLVVAVVGKARNPALGEAIRDYEKRAARYWPLDVHEVREERAAGISADKVREREGKRLSDKVPERAQTVACAVDAFERDAVKRLTTDPGNVPPKPAPVPAATRLTGGPIAVPASWSIPFVTSTIT